MSAAPATDPPFDVRQLGERLDALLPVPGAAVCVAFSAGLDSAALLHALAALRRERGARRLPLRALHVDHHLQAASAAFRTHAVAAARRLRVPLRVLDAPPLALAGRSVEEVAREARYALLAAALRPGECLVTAQHADDQFETMLLQLLRGAGLAGLAAMPARAPLGAGWQLRPLLDTPRAALASYAAANGLDWCEDPTNTDLRFDRNYLRHRVLPALRERWPAAARSAARSARLLGEARHLLDAVAAADVAAAADGDGLDVRVLRRLPPPRQRAALRAFLAARAVTPPDERRLLACQRLLAVRGDAQARVEWGSACLRRQGDLLHLLPRQRATAPFAAVAWDWRSRAPLVLPGSGGTLRIARAVHGDVDLARLPSRLLVRGRAGGERLRSGGSSRAVTALLQAAGVPPWERDAVPLVAAAEEPARLLAVGDLAVADAIRAGPASGSRQDAQRGRFVWKRSP